MSTQAQREYLFCIWKQYLNAAKIRKSELINEVQRNLGLHRKAVIRLLNRPWEPRSQQARPGPRSSRYSPQAKKQLGVLRHLMGYMCAERMKAALPEWLQYREHKDCSEAIKAEILRMSVRSIGRSNITGLRGSPHSFQCKRRWEYVSPADSPTTNGMCIKTD